MLSATKAIKGRPFSATLDMRSSSYLTVKEFLTITARRRANHWKYEKKKRLHSRFFCSSSIAQGAKQRFLSIILKKMG